MTLIRQKNDDDRRKAKRAVRSPGRYGSSNSCVYIYVCVRLRGAGYSKVTGKDMRDQVTPFSFTRR